MPASERLSPNFRVPSAQRTFESDRELILDELSGNAQVQAIQISEYGGAGYQRHHVPAHARWLSRSWWRGFVNSYGIATGDHSRKFR
jgi:hypothetical protein